MKLYLVIIIFCIGYSDGIESETVVNNYIDHIRISKCKFPAAFISPIHSENKTYYYMIKTPDLSGEKPYTTQIYIYSEKDSLTLVELFDHTNFSPRVKWSNDNLIFIRVFWDDFIRTDLLFDVEKDSIFSNEFIED